MPHLYPDYLLIREFEILLFIFILVFHYNFKYLSWRKSVQNTLSSVLRVIAARWKIFYVRC